MIPRSTIPAVKSASTGWGNNWKTPPPASGSDWRTNTAPSPYRLRTGAFEPAAPTQLPATGIPLTSKLASMIDKDLRAAIAQADADTATPTDAQRESGNYKKGKFTWNGIGITIETAKGQKRTGVNKATKQPWSVTLKNSYGYIRGTDSAEPGDQMDVFVGTTPESEVVYVVDQNKQDGKTFDEHKVCIACTSAAQAKQLYHDNYNKGWSGFRNITALTVPQFKNWLKSGDMTKPLCGQEFAKFHKTAGMLTDLKTKAEGLAGRVLDPVKRYVSNLPDLYTYDKRHVVNAIKYLPKAHELGVQDVQQKDPNAGYINSVTDNLRRELLRRGLGVHRPGAADLFQPAANGTLQLSNSLSPQQKLDPNVASPLLGWLIESKFNKHPIYDAARSAVNDGISRAGGPSVRIPTASSVLGNYSMQYKGNGIFNVRDKWDVGLNPGDKELMQGQGVVGLARRALDSIMKPAVFDQDFQQLRDGSIAPLSSSMIKGSSAVKVAVDWAALGQKVREQMPGFHGWDTLAGATLAAVPTYAMSATSNSKRTRNNRWRNTLLAAAGGGLAANVVGDRARRYITNIPGAFGYETSSMTGPAMRAGLKGVWDGAVLDKPIAPVKGEQAFNEEHPNQWLPEALPRRELLRRALGVHAPTDKDFFASTGTSAHKGVAHDRLEFHPRMFKAPGSNELNKDGEQLFEQSVQPEGWAAMNKILQGGEAASSADKSQYDGRSIGSSIFGNLPMQNIGDSRQMRDVWDFDWSPQDAAHFKQIASTAWRQPSSLLAPFSNAEAKDELLRTAGDKVVKNTDVLKSLLARKILNNVLVKSAPVFEQNFVQSFNPEADITTATDTPKLFRSPTIATPNDANIGKGIAAGAGVIGAGGLLDWMLRRNPPPRKIKRHPRPTA